MLTRAELDKIGGVRECTAHSLANCIQYFSDINDCPGREGFLSRKLNGPTRFVSLSNRLISVPNFPNSDKSGFCEGENKILSPKS